jgi:hypothetical protein
MQVSSGASFVKAKTLRPLTPDPRPRARSALHPIHASNINTAHR